jgi:glucose/arabinose dehydrogenase
MNGPDTRTLAFGASIGLPLFFACAALLLPGCGERESAPPKPAPPVSPGSAHADESPPNEVPVKSAAVQPRDVAVIVRDVLAVPPGNKDRPLARINNLIHAGDGSGRLFVSEMNGRLYVIKDEKVLPEPFLDMTVARRGAFMAGEEFEQGFTGFAFHPDFAKPGRPGFGKLYTASTEVPGSGKPDFPSPYPTAHVEHHNVLAEWSIDPGDPNQVDPASRREVLRIAHPRRDHVMSQLGFAPHAKPGDPDYGMLYIGVGDGGNTTFQYKKVDAWHVAQNRLSPHGKILRINPLAAGDRKYSIPSDNPFVRDASYLKEIWALGLRNPQRFSWDPGGDHLMLIADIGQAQVEEINIGRPGANYGWGEREGTFVVDPDDENHLSPPPAGDERFGYTYPAVQYRHDLSRAVTGGFVYRGKALPALYGKYLFGDIVSGRIFFVDVSTLVSGRPSPFGEIKLRYLGRERSMLEIVGEDRADLRFGIDDRGAIYLLTKRDGMVRKLSIPALE